MQEKRNTIWLYSVISLLIFFLVLLNGVIEKQLYNYFMPEEAEKYNVAVVIFDENGNDVTEGKSEGSTDNIVKPFVKALAVTIELFLGITTGCIYIFIKYKHSQRYWIPWIEKALPIIKVVFIIGTAYTLVYMLYVESFEIQHFITSAQDADRFRNEAMRLFYDIRGEVYVITQISGAYWIPLEYCIAKENAIVRAEDKEKFETLVKTMTENNNMISEGIERIDRIERSEGLKGDAANRVDNLQHNINHLEGTIDGLRKRIKRLEKTSMKKTRLK